MKCPNCNVEMEQGHLYNHGNFWGNKDFNGASRIVKWMTKGYVQVIAYRCPSCKNIQLVTDK